MTPDTEDRFVRLVLSKGIVDCEIVRGLAREREGGSGDGERRRTLARLLLDQGVLKRQTAVAVLEEVRATAPPNRKKTGKTAASAVRAALAGKVPGGKTSSGKSPAAKTPSASRLKTPTSRVKTPSGRRLDETLDPCAPHRGGDVATLLPGAQLGHYKVVSVLGRGGTSIVYRAIDLRLGREVALKMIPGGAANPVRVARLRREARVEARVRHPGTVQVLGTEQHDGAFMVVLELLEGGSLRERLERSGPLAPREAAQLVRDLARTLDAVHRQGLLHLDVKPANVLLDREGKPKLGDFGLAREQRSLHRASRRVAERMKAPAPQARPIKGDFVARIRGTIPNMAPEQALAIGEWIEPRTDVYGLGTVLYEALTGKRVHEGKTDLDTLLSVVNDAPARPSSHRGVPRDLEAICLKALGKDRTQRYASARALADELEHYLRGQPISARTPRLHERVARWARRNRALACAAAASFALGVGFTVAALVVGGR